MSDRTLFASADTRCWARGDAVVLTFEQARPAVTPDVLDALERAVAVAEREFATLVINSASEHFAFGADLDDAFAATAAGHPEVLERALDRYQGAMLRMRHASVPTVAAVRGVAVSGGCELLMHCTRVVAHPVSHIGLVETSVGVLPGGGGVKEFAARAATSNDQRAAIVQAFETLSAAIVAPTAADAQRLGFLTPSDRIDAADPLAEAIETGLALHATEHVPPSPNPLIRVAGREIEAELCAAASRRHGEGRLTAHQLEITARLARVLCGDDSGATALTEAEWLALERRHFVALAQTLRTQERLAHLRATGQALSN